VSGGRGAARGGRGGWEAKKRCSPSSSWQGGRARPGSGGAEAKHHLSRVFPEKVAVPGEGKGIIQLHTQPPALPLLPSGSPPVPLAAPAPAALGSPQTFSL